MFKAIEVRPFMHEGRAYMVAIVPDDHTTPDHADCYTPADIERWRAGDWRYVGVIVIDESGSSDSLWAVHYGYADGWHYGLDSILNDEYGCIDGVPHTLPQSLAMDIQGS